MVSVTGIISGFLPNSPKNAVVAVLHEGAHGFGSIHDFEGVERRRQSGEHVGFGHGQVDHAELHQRMAASQQVLRVHVGDGASGGNVHVAMHQDGAHRRAGLHGLRLFGVAYRTRTHHRDDSRGRELRGEALHCIFGESIEDERAFRWA